MAFRFGGSGEDANLLLFFCFLDGFGLFLRRLGGSWRCKRRRKTNEAQENKDWKQGVEQRLLPVEIHRPPDLGVLSAISRAVGGLFAGRESETASEVKLTAPPPRGCLVHADRRTSCWTSEGLLSDA